MFDCGVVSHDANSPCCVAKETEQILLFHVCQACVSTCFHCHERAIARLFIFLNIWHNSDYIMVCAMLKLGESEGIPPRNFFLKIDTKRLNLVAF